MFDGLLRPKRQQRRDWIDIEPIEAQQVAMDLSRYSEEDRTIVEHLLRSIVKPTTLSDLLAYARAQRFTRAQCDIIVLLVMQHYDVESTEKPMIHVEKANTLLIDPEYYGDEVWLSPFE